MQIPAEKSPGFEIFASCYLLEINNSYWSENCFVVILEVYIYGTSSRCFKQEKNNFEDFIDVS